MRRHVTPLRLALLAGLAVLIALPIWCSRAPRPGVQIAHARRGPLQMKVATNGQVEPLDEAEMVVRARLAGRVLALPDPGTRVAAGDELLRIDDAPVASDLARAESDRLAAGESLRAVKHERAVLAERFATDRKLYEQQALTRQRFADSEAALRDAEARVSSLEREVPLRVSSLEWSIADLRARLNAAVVRAPFAGTVYKTAIKKGDVVREGDRILWLADLEKLRVRANVDQADLGRVQPGQKIVISTNAFPGRAWNGQISEMIPNVEVKENRSVSEGLARIDPPTEGLVPGMRVDIEIIVAEAEDALQVPSEAIFADGKKPFVYKLDGRRLKKAPVELGLTSVTSAEIRSGLDENDVIVAEPAQGLGDGVKVKVQRPRGEGPGAERTP